MKFLHHKLLLKNNSNRTDLKAACKSLYTKLQSIDLASLSLSDYGLEYLKRHQNSLQYLFQMYTFILNEMQIKVQKPFHEITVIDHGAGIGLLSFLCAELNMKVIHNDVYSVVCNDAKLLSEALELPISNFHHGDTKELVAFCKEKKLEVDAIISSEVIEHIYNVDAFLNELKNIPSQKLHFVFSTSANEKNKFRRKKLIKQQLKAEYIGFQEFKGRKEKDAIQPFYELRKQMIHTSFPEIDDSDVEIIAKRTRGKKREDIFKDVIGFQDFGLYPQENIHPTNTCDPITGNWTEQLMCPHLLVKKLDQNGFIANIKAGYYGVENDSFISKIVKHFLNLCIRVLGKKGIKISHYWMLVG